jgi:hypothetical protein
MTEQYRTISPEIQGFFIGPVVILPDLSVGPTVFRFHCGCELLKNYSGKFIWYKCICICDFTCNELFSTFSLEYFIIITK